MSQRPSKRVAVRPCAQEESWNAVTTVAAERATTARKNPAVWPTQPAGGVTSDPERRAASKRARSAGFRLCGKEASTTRVAGVAGNRRCNVAIRSRSADMGLTSPTDTTDEPATRRYR